MIIKNQRGKLCPRGGPWEVGSILCEECNDWQFKIRGSINNTGIKYADEYCEELRACNEG